MAQSSCAVVWPVQGADSKGLMSVYGDYRFNDLGCNVHAAIDITQAYEDDPTDSCQAPVVCVQDSEFVCYIVNNEAPLIRPENIDGIVLLCNGDYHVYQHVKGINPRELKKLQNFPMIDEGQQLGHIAERGDPAYGNSSPHLHFAVFSGNVVPNNIRLRINFFYRMTIAAIYGFDYKPGGTYPIENPLNILPNASVNDSEPPIFQHSEVSGTQLDLVPNLDFQNSQVFGTGYVDKGKWPWVVRGKVDIIARVNDYMNVVGMYDEGSYTTEVIPGIFEIKYEILQGTMPVIEKKLIWNDLPDSNYNGMLPGGVSCEERFNRSLPVHPHSTSTFYCEGYDSFRYNYSYFVVSNTDGSNIDHDGCWDTAGMADGIYTVRVTAKDHAGNSSSIEMDVSVRNADIFVDAFSKRPFSNGTAENPFKKIGEGLNAASYGDVVFVAPGTYNNENLPLDIPNGVKLVGAGPESTTILGNGSSGIISLQDTYSETWLEGFTLRGAGTGSVNAAVYANNAAGVVFNNRFTENSGYAIYALESQFHLSESFLISNNIIDNCLDGIYNHSCADTLKIENTTIYDTYIGINNYHWSSPLITNCILSNNYVGVMANSNSDPVFSFNSIDSISSDYDWDYSSSITRISNTGSPPFFLSGPNGDFYLNPISGCINYGLDSNVSVPEIYSLTTQAISTPFPSGNFDDIPVDLGYHYYPICVTPTPPPTPTVGGPTPCSTSPQQSAGWIRLSREFYETVLMTASVEVADSDLNTNPYAQETVDITVSNGAKASIPFTLKEVSTNSSLFSSASNDQDLEFTLGTSIDYQAIQMVDEDTVTVTYNDLSYSIDRTDDAIWYEFGAPTRTPSPTCTITPTPTGTWFTPTPSPTITETPTPTGTWATSTPVPTVTPTETPGGPTVTPSVTPGPWTATDFWGYTGTTLTTYNWIDATAGTALGIIEDDEYESVTLPFTFDFYGVTYDTVNVSSNGFLTFGASGENSENDYMPKETEPNAVIAPFFDNLNPADTGIVYYLDSGTSATFEWDLFRHNRSWTDSYTFEVTLYEDGRIEFQYFVMSGIYADGYDATVGIENADGTVGLRYRGKYEAGIVEDGMAILFTPPLATPVPTSTPETQQEVMVETFEDGADDWRATGLWHLVETGTGNPCAKAHDGTKSFWYGLDANCTFDTGTANAGELVSPPIQLAENISFTFWSWEEVQPNTAFGFADNRSILVSDDDGATWELAFFHVPNTTGWEQHSVELFPWRNKTVRIKFVFDTINADLNDYPGWYVDDIEIESSVPPPIPSTSSGGIILLMIVLGVVFWIIPKQKHNA